MIKSLFRLLVILVVVSLAAVIATRYFDVQFGNENYWHHHGLFFLIFITLFPRLTLLLSSVMSGGLIWWLAWLVTPRILVATLATLSYWQQNPLLVAISWLVAIGGETSEKYVFVRQSGFRGGGGFRNVGPQDGFKAQERVVSAEVIDIEPINRESPVSK